MDASSPPDPGGTPLPGKKLTDTFKLIEAILLEIDMHTIFVSQRINRSFRDTVKNSAKLQRSLVLDSHPKLRETTSLTDFKISDILFKRLHPTRHDVTCRFPPPRPRFQIPTIQAPVWNSRRAIRICCDQGIFQAKPGSWQDMSIARSGSPLECVVEYYGPIADQDPKKPWQLYQVVKQDRYTAGMLVDWINSDVKERARCYKGSEEMVLSL